MWNAVLILLFETLFSGLDQKIATNILVELGFLPQASVVSKRLTGSEVSYIHSC
ncbi:hypothetical protein J4731_08130 [Providencia rettgeri]|nr:hypothetical protein [Providencia rettgeri]